MGGDHIFSCHTASRVKKSGRAVAESTLCMIWQNTDYLSQAIA